MDEILERFETTLGRGQSEDNSSHRDLYKNWGKYGNQEERRTEILQQQKSNRENKLDYYRGIYNLVDCAKQMDCAEGRSVFRESYQATYKPRSHVPGFTHNCYSKILMHSEWIVEKPEDFSTNWFVAPCPKGTRVLVIACNGKTRLYTKYGQLFGTVASRLPGGYGDDKFKDSSVLDGFYCKEIETVYVLDVLFWKNHIMADGEMEFRRYWLEGKFSEHPEFGRITKKYKVSFKLLPMVPCDTDSLQNFMMTHPPLPEAKLDGLLFYHRHGNYISGETPLVGWLYPYMVPEILCPGMTIHESYEALKPPDYVDQATFIKTFEQKNKKKKTPLNWRKKKNRNTSETSMEAEDIPAEQQGDENATLENGNSENEVDLDSPNGENEVLNGQNGSNAALNQSEAVNTEKGQIQALTSQNEPMETLITQSKAIQALLCGVDQSGDVIQSNSLFSDQDPTQRSQNIA